MDRIFTFFSPTKRMVAVNTASQLLGRVISALTTFVVTIIVARNFGANGYGDFVKVTTFAAFFYLVADFGINAIFLQLNEREHWPALVALRLLGGTALIIISLVILSLLPGAASQGYTPWVRLGILLFSPTILLQGLITTANAMFQKHLRYDRATWSIFFGSVITVILIWMLVYVAHSTNLLMVIGLVALGTLVTTTVSFLFASRLVGRVVFSPTVAQIKLLLIPSIPLGITLLFNLVYFRADSVVITLTRPTAEVGIYGLAYKVFEVALVFPTFFMNAVYPLLLKQQNYQLSPPKADRPLAEIIKNQKFKAILLQSTKVLLITSAVSLVALWFAAPLLTFIKNDFTESISALRVLALGLPFFFVTAVTMWGLIALKKQTLLAGIYGASMLINIVGNIILVPTYGFMAAAWMTVGSEALVLFLSAFTLVRSLQDNR